MATKFETSETASEILFVATQQRGLWPALCESGGLLVFCYLFRRAFPLPLWVLILMAVTYCSWRFHRSFRERHVKTKVTKFEIEMEGYFGDYSPARSIPMAEVWSLDYRAEVPGNGEETYQPEGLWASHGNSATCIVPFVDEKESRAAADMIERHFGHVIASAIPSGFSSNLTSLNLKF